MSVKGRDLAAKRAWFMGQLRPRRRRWRRQRAAGRGSGWRCAPGRPIKAGADGSAPRSCLLRRRSGAAGFPAPFFPPTFLKYLFLPRPSFGERRQPGGCGGGRWRGAEHGPRASSCCCCSAWCCQRRRSAAPGPAPAPAPQVRRGAVREGEPRAALRRLEAAAVMG